jgi:hypothetical protein
MSTPQKYLFTKVQPLPIDVEYSIQDTLESIRPNITMYTSVAEVDQAIAEISPQLKNLLGTPYFLSYLVIYP